MHRLWIPPFQYWLYMHAHGCPVQDWIESVNVFSKKVPWELPAPTYFKSNYFPEHYLNINSSLTCLTLPRCTEQYRCCPCRQSLLKQLLTLYCPLYAKLHVSYLDPMLGNGMGVTDCAKGCNVLASLWRVWFVWIFYSRQWSCVVRHFTCLSHACESVTMEFLIPSPYFVCCFMHTYKRIVLLSQNNTGILYLQNVLLWFFLTWTWFFSLLLHPQIVMTLRQNLLLT